MLSRRLTVVSCFAAAAMALAACGGGSNTTTSVTDMTGGNNPGGGAPSGSPAPYSVSVNGNSFGTTPVTVSAEAVTVRSQTVSLEARTQVGSQPGHYRVFDTPGSTSGPALELRYFGHNRGYNHLQFGSWARGNVSPNSGFQIGEQFGAFLAPSARSAPTPVSNMPTEGVAIYRGYYSGYTDTGSSVVTEEGRADISVNLDYVVSHPRIAVTLWGSTRRIVIAGVLTGNTFEVDVTRANEFVSGVPRADAVQISDGITVESANSGGMRGGFFGNDAAEVGGIYQFTSSRINSAVGAFGGRRQ